MNDLITLNSNSEIGTFYTSFRGETSAEKAQLFKIMNTPRYKVSDCINKTILLKDLYVEMVSCTNEQTGEVSVAPRIVLIDKDNEGYQCVSTGILSALKKLMQIYGEPTWDEPLPIKIIQLKKGARSILTFELAV